MNFNMIIFLRGLPVSGKTTLANILANELNWNVIHVDDYKNEFIHQNANALFSKEVIPYSHKKTLEELSNIKNNANVVVEEIFWNKDFVQELLDLCKKNNVQCQWFKLVRDKKDFLSAKRKIRNTLRDFETMEKQIDDIKIEGEIVINNQNIDESIKKIITILYLGKNVY